MQIARGSMGEYRAFGESILGEYIFTAKQVCLSVVDYSDVLYSLNAEKFKYVHTNAFCYNKCKINSSLKTALVAAIIGEQ